MSKVWRREKLGLETRKARFGDKKSQVWRLEELGLETRRARFGDEKDQVWRLEEVGLIKDLWTRNCRRLVLKDQGDI